MSRVLAFLYGAICYLMFLGVFLYAVGFVGNIVVPKSVDSGPATSTAMALVINALLLTAFALQHSIMARIGFKKVWTKIVPLPVERSTFVLFTNLVLILMFWQWRPLNADIWVVDNAVLAFVLHTLFWAGWLIVLLATFMIDHFDLFGLRQVWLYLRRKEYTRPSFQTTGLYKHVRHPIMLGFIIAFWSTPHMTLGHLMFAIATTGYILVGIQLEEKDLVSALGDDYRFYRRQVSMLAPRLTRLKTPPAPTTDPAVEQNQ